MRIRIILLVAFVIATLMPAGVFGWRTYSEGVEREFADVKDRQLLLAQNLGRALSRYHKDLLGAFTSVSEAFISGKEIPNMFALLENLHLECIVLINKVNGGAIASLEVPSFDPAPGMSPKTLVQIKKWAKPGKTVFSPVVAHKSNRNVMYIIRDTGSRLIVGRLTTEYFVKLGAAIAFGRKGHAAIVDHQGNVLAHPLKSWIAARKNIAKVSAVQRMMRGETGIQQFYSPALKGDMIAGLTSVKGPGWGVMIPQPVAGLYSKARSALLSMVLTIVLAFTLVMIFVVILPSNLVRPLEEYVSGLKANASRLNKVPVSGGMFAVAEVKDLQNTYNHMVERIDTANSEIERMAFTDPVTQLPNRGKFQTVFAAALDGRDGYSGHGGLVFIDLDDFKDVNDLHGHDIGDVALRTCGRSLLASARKNLPENGVTADPVVARVGGDEFAVLLPDMTDPADLRTVLERMLADMCGQEIPGLTANLCSASIGCAIFPRDGDNLEQVFKHADIAMYEAKKKGKNRVDIYDACGIGLTPAEIRDAFAEAIEADELDLEYQPKISVNGETACAAEALVRWRHPTHNSMPPDSWLPAISNSPLMSKLGEWVLARAMRDQKRLALAGHEVAIAINIGAQHVATNDFVERLCEIADRYGADR